MVARRPIVVLERLPAPLHKVYWQIADAHMALRECSAKPVFIAGGCLRDDYYNVDIRDIDCYVGPDFNSNDLQLALGKEWCLEIDIKPGNIERYRDYFGEIIGEVWKANAINRLPLQIMIWKEEIDLPRLLASMDFGFCQIGYDGREIWTTAAFRKDTTSNTCTYTMRDDDPRLLNSYARKQRLALKYPTRTWVWPDGIEEADLAAAEEERSGMGDL